MGLALIAIGGNSLTRENQVGTVAEQFANARQTSHHLVQVIQAGWDLILTHGNGPQVGAKLHRVELAADIGTDEQYAELKRVAMPMLEEWSETKKAPRHADWLHEIAREEHAKAKAAEEPDLP